ncbi:hypothetical protein RYH80_18090 [Halobaculum sp. MBLA0147]|uniref:hypothetical protein n=1 Tax=Halobaculum sp. MBLA0147 TaxID=3079934 RepID=UPI003523D1A3
MTDDTSSQTNLSGFDSAQPASSTPTSSTSSSTDALASSSSPLADELSGLYNDVASLAESQLPSSLADLPDVTSLAPTTQTGRTNAVPDCVSVAPSTVGPFTLATHSEDHLQYQTTGPAYEPDNGHGGSILTIKLYRQGDEYHRRTTCIVGFENPDTVRNQTVSGPLSGTVRGHDPKENPGDFSVTHAAEPFEPEDANPMTAFILYLHHHPGALSQSLPQDPDNWTCARLTANTGWWSAAAPESIPGDQLRLILRDDTLTLFTHSPATDVISRSYQSVTALPDPLDDICTTVSEGEYRFPTPAAATEAARTLLSASPKSIIKTD